MLRFMWWLLLVLLAVAAPAAILERTSAECADGSYTSTGSVSGCRPYATSFQTGDSLGQTSTNVTVQMEAAGGTFYIATWTSATSAPADCAAVQAGSGAVDTSSKTIASTTVNFDGVDNVSGLSTSTEYTTYGCGVNGARIGEVVEYTFTTLAGGGGGGNDLTGTVFVLDTAAADGGDGLTPATAWNDCGDITGMSVGSDLLIMDDSDENSTMCNFNWGGSAGDKAIIRGGYVDSLDGNILRWYDDGLGGNRGAKPDLANVTVTDTNDHTELSDVHVSNSIAGDVVVWNPGPSMMVKGPLSKAFGPDPNKTERHAQYASLLNEDKVRSVTVLKPWGGIEYITEGNYGSPGQTEWGAYWVKEDLDEIASAGKKMVIRIIEQKDSSNPYGSFPNYAIDDGCVCTSISPSKSVFRSWDATCRSKFKNMLTGLGSVIGNSPHLEGLWVNQETAIGDCNSDTGYSHDNYIAAMKDIMEHAAEQFPTAWIIASWNDRVAGMSQAKFEELFDYVKTKERMGIGWPDTAPECVGLCNSDPVTYDIAVNQRDNYEYYHDNASEGLQALHCGVESSELGEASVGAGEGYTPSAIHDYQDDYLGCTHKMWVAVDYGSAYQTSEYHCWGGSPVATAPNSPFTCAFTTPDWWILDGTDGINSRTFPVSGNSDCPANTPSSKCYVDD